ncbi:MAG: excinuclease ABC subunit UvrC [bacterium]|nr:excinuclease ABC subunit UvrC [bacterium]MDE0353029.1 excinuclease ABC subunit UvrC [bacterium]
MNRPLPAEIPDAPGAYLFRDRHGRVNYVGKANSLRKRVSTYFTGDLPPRTQAMIEASDGVEWIMVDSEVAALFLEFSLIKEHRPRFNIRLRDDKSYPYLAITRSDLWPRARVVRGAKRKGVQYFGPFAHAYAIRNTLDLLLKSLPIRTCSDTVFRRHELKGRPCIEYEIDRCSAPCVGYVDPDTYTGYVNGLEQVLSGSADDLIERIEARMREASDRLEFESAARLRDQAQDVRRAVARQEVVTDRREDFDLIAMDETDLETSVQVLKVRNGRIVGRLGSIIDKVEDVTPSQVTATVLRDLYDESSPPPRLILVEALPPDDEPWSDLLSQRRGTRVTLRSPKRGAKRRLLETAKTNAAEALLRHRLRRQSDHNARARDLRSLQTALVLPEPPLRIEAYDISTIQGRHTVASMVVLEDGLPRRSDYRRFRIRTVTGQDDFSSMEEVVRRRFTAYLADLEKPVSERGKFAYPPSLVLIDGGPGQIARAVEVLARLDLDIPVAGLAKRMEEVYVPGQVDPIVIPRDQPALHLLQRVRDEAHRFALMYHRQLRGKRMIDSILDDVDGVGPARKKALVRTFGSVKKMREASVSQLAEVVPLRVAENLYATLHG